MIKPSIILLMVQKSGDHQLRLVVYPIIYRVLAPSQVVGLGISEPSTVSQYQGQCDTTTWSLGLVLDEFDHE